MPFAGIENILVIKLRHIGDVLLTVPVFRALRQTFPKARIGALVNPGTEQMLLGHPSIDDVLVLDRGAKDLSPIRRMLHQGRFLLELRKRGYDMTVDLTGGDRPAIISFLSGAHIRIGWEPSRGLMGKRRLYTHLSKPEDSHPMVLQNLEVVRPFGIDTDDLTVDFHFADRDRQTVLQMIEEQRPNPESIVHVHPSSRWLFKCWKDEYMAEVIRFLADCGHTVAVTSSPVRYEMEKTARVLDLAGRERPGIVDLGGRTTIKQLGALSSISRLFFGVDSAPMHIAAAVGTPVVALFGPSAAFQWAPWDPQCGREPVFERNGIRSLGPHSVLQSRRECVPCSRDGCNGSKRSLCLEELNPTQVIDVIENKFKSSIYGQA